MRERWRQAPAKNDDNGQFFASKAAGNILWDFGSCELPNGKTQSGVSDPWQPFLDDASKFDPQEPLEIPKLVPSNNNLENAAPVELNTEQPFDFWQPFSNTEGALLEQSRTNFKSADQFNYKIPLPKSGLHTSPFAFEFRKPSTDEIAARRARNLLVLINDAYAVRRTTILILFFAEIFETYPHASTFRALSELALNDVPVETIVQTCRFRLIWEERPEWHSCRYKGKFYASHPRISWLRAWRWVELCSGDNPADHIEDEWVRLWAGLEIGDRSYGQFANYIDEKLSTFSKGIWEPPNPICYKRTPAIANHGFGETSLKSRTGLLVKGICDPPYEYKPKKEIIADEQTE